MKSMFLVVLMLINLSCASVHPGKYGMVQDETGSLVSMKKNPSNGIVISAETDNSYSNDYSKFMVFTIENKSGSLKKITDATPIINNNNEIRVMSGQDLGAWFEQQTSEKERKEKNRKTIGGVATVAGGLLAAFTDDTWEAIGVGLLAGGATSLTLDQLTQDKNTIERGKIFPASHLMAEAYEVSPGLYERKWIVFGVDIPTEAPTELELEYRVADGHLQRVVIPLKW